jgi:hypothetical protein
VARAGAAPASSRIKIAVLAELGHSSDQNRPLKKRQLGQ